MLNNFDVVDKSDNYNSYNILLLVNTADSYIMTRSYMHYTLVVLLYLKYLLAIALFIFVDAFNPNPILKFMLVLALILDKNTTVTLTIADVTLTNADVMLLNADVTDVWASVTFVFFLFLKGIAKWNIVLW